MKRPTRLPSHAAADAAVLTARQRDVLSQLAAGATEKEAARALGISVHTLHVHAKGIYRRLGVTSRGELLAKVYSQLSRQAAGEGHRGRARGGRGFPSLARDRVRRGWR